MIIKIYDRIIDYDDDISLVLQSPLFYDSISYSLQFNVKNTITNRQIFGFLNKPEIAENTTKELPSTMTFGLISYTGTIVVTWQSGAFNCYFKENGDFWTAIKDKLLSDIPYDKSVLSLDYSTINQLMEHYLGDDCDRAYTFPYVINKKIGDKLTIKTTFAERINDLSLIEALVNVPIIPFLFLHYITRNIFEKNGIALAKNAFDSNKFLKRLLVASNYMINEFSLDTTVVSTTNWFIKEIQNSSGPEVTTIEPHGLDNYQFIQIDHVTPEIKIYKRIFQIELIYDENKVKDEYKFKLLNEDFSTYTDAYSRDYVRPSSVEKNTYETSLDRIFLRFVNVDLPTNDNAYYYMRSDDWNGIIKIGNSGNDDIFVASINLRNSQETSDLINDPDFSTHTYNNCRLLSISDYHNDKLTAHSGVLVHDAYYNSIMEGTIIELPSMLINRFNSINPAKHVPNLTINQFLTDLKTLGIATFVRQNNQVDILLMKDILNASEFTDISDISTLLSDIVNPAVDGYYLKFTTDSNDDFCKTMLPVQVIDKKYTIKDPVATNTDLSVTGSETNDVRLVIDENAFYAFNKSFLNADNNWKLLCYNNIDLQNGNGDLKKEVKCSPLIPVTIDNVKWNEFDIACASLTFPNDIVMNMRLLSYYLLGSGTIPYATSETTGPDGSEIAGSELAIKWNSEKGIANVLLKEYLYWETNVRKDCKAIIYWPSKLLANFDFAKKYRIRNIDYLVKSIKFSVTKNGLKYNETELAKV